MAKVGFMKMALSLGLATGLLVPAGFAQGVTQRDTGGMNMGGVNAINKKGAGVTQPLPSIQADGPTGVNAVNIRQGGGVRQNLNRIDADVPRDSGILVSPTGDLQMKRLRQ